MSDSQEKWDFAEDSWQVGLDIYPLKSRIGEVKTLAGVVELADTIDLGSIAARRAGSSPVSGTYKWLRTIEPARANFALGGFFFFSVRSLHATLVIGKDFRPYLLTN